MTQKYSRAIIHHLSPIIIHFLRFLFGSRLYYIYLIWFYLFFYSFDFVMHFKHYIFLYFFLFRFFRHFLCCFAIYVFSKSWIFAGFTNSCYFFRVWRLPHVEETIPTNITLASIIIACRKFEAINVEHSGERVKKTRRRRNRWQLCNVKWMCKRP